jgi:hypothetical protein
MRQIALVLAMMPLVMPEGARAEDWQRLDGPGIVAALTGRSLTYAGGETQGFHADGSTLYGDEVGKWRVQGDQYCSTWPPRDSWTCYVLEQSGPQLRFIGEVGNTTVGKYNDL